jgi:CDP-diacylglycerol pyrophosphatase
LFDLNKVSDLFPFRVKSVSMRRPTSPVGNAMQAATMPVPAGRRTSGKLSGKFSGKFRGAALAIAAWVGSAGPAPAANPDALWEIVSEKCVPDQQQHHDPSPCAEVDLASGVARGHVVLKDLEGATQFLLIPTARVAGIESPALLAPGAPNYWAPAWRARRFVIARAHRRLPRDAIGLAVNSVKARSQNQLHIHVDCVRPDLRRYLARHAARLSRHWSRLKLEFNGRRYLALRLASPDLRGVDPFRLLARGIAAARRDMADWTLVAVGAKSGGFVLLAGHVDAATNDDGSGEDLLDHSCALARAVR